MPRLAKGLTVKQVEAAKPETVISDGKGLTLAVDGSGNKRWVFRYTRPNGKRNALGFGSYPDVSLLVARSLTIKAREALARGEDPGQIKKAAKSAARAATSGTFRAVAEKWYSHKAKSWAGETARKARETLDDTLYPKLADYSIQDITTADCKPILVTLHERAPRLAIKARQYCNQIIEYAIQEGLRDDGKLLSLKGVLPKTKTEHYAAVTKSNDLPSLIKVINSIESVNSRTALLVCLYTASRPGVVAGMRWDELDLDSKEWHIPADRMKTGNDHITPLPDQLVVLLEEIKPLAGNSPFVFPGFRDPIKQHIHRDSLSKILRESGLRDVTVTHGFRATFRTIARERLRASPDVLEAQLAHAKKDEIQAAYDRAQFLEERHLLVQQWANYLHQVSSENKVVMMRGKI